MDDTQAAKAVSSSSDRSPSWSVTIKAQIQHQALNNAQFHPSPAASSTFGFLLKSPQFWITKAANSKKWLWKQTGLLGWFMSMNQTAVVLHTICFWAPFPPLSSCQGYSAPLLCCTSTQMYIFLCITWVLSHFIVYLFFLSPLCGYVYLTSSSFSPHPFVLQHFFGHMPVNKSRDLLLSCATRAVQRFLIKLNTP